MLESGINRKYFIVILLLNIIFPKNNFLDIVNSSYPDRSYFSINISPNGSLAALTNSNYTQLDIIDKEIIVKVNVENINGFQSKWSLDSKKLLVMRSTYTNKRRLNSLIVLNNNGSVIHTVIDFTNQNIYPIGWTGINTLHFLLDDKLITRNLEASDNEWDVPLIYSIENELFKKIDGDKSQLLYKAQNRILNLNYSQDAGFIVFEVYSHETIYSRDITIRMIEKCQVSNAHIISNHVTNLIIPYSIPRFSLITR